MTEPLLIRCTGHEISDVEYGSKRVLYLVDVTLGINTITVKKRARDFYRLHTQVPTIFLSRGFINQLCIWLDVGYVALLQFFQARTSNSPSENGVSFF